MRRAAVPALTALAEAGATVLGVPELHSKAIVADGSRGLVTTANLAAFGLDPGVELGVVIDGARAGAIAHSLAAWCARATHELCITSRIGDASGDRDA